MYTGGMAYWYGGNLSLLYSFQINKLRSVVLLLGMYFFYRMQSKDCITYCIKKPKMQELLQKEPENGAWGIGNIRFG